MITLELSPKEADMLRDILVSYVSDLRMEISNTDSMDVREGLKEREVLLKRLIQQLEDRRREQDHRQPCCPNQR
jgi:hypothetical protein